MSTKIFETKQKLSQALTEYKAIVSKEADLPTDETLADDDVDRLAVLEKDIAVLQARVARLEASEAMPDVDMLTGDDEPTTDDDKALGSLVLNKQFTVAGPRATTYAQAAVPLEKGLRAARFLIGKALAIRNGPRAAAEIISKTFHDEIVSKAIVSVAGTGATTIPTYFATDIIELLRPMVVVRAAGAATIDTTGGNLTMPRLSAAATAQWQTEVADILTSNETIDTVVLSNKKLTALVSVSNDLIRRSPLGIDQIVRDDLLAVIARAEDTAFLTSTGAGGSPIGLRAQSGIQTGVAPGFDLPSVVSTIVGMKTHLQMVNARMLRPAWIMSPMLKNFISSLRDSVGGFFVFKQELDNDMLAGFPVHTTTNLPVNLVNYAVGGASGTKGSDLFLVDFGEVILGDTLNVDIETSTVASYFDGTALQSAFSKDLCLFRVIKETDLALRHPQSVCWYKTDSWTLF